jgi:hypothetical protein
VTVVEKKEEREPEIYIKINGVEFTFDSRNADPSLMEEIGRLIKGFFKILERRAQKRAT